MAWQAFEAFSIAGLPLTEYRSTASRRSPPASPGRSCRCARGLPRPVSGEGARSTLELAAQEERPRWWCDIFLPRP